MTRRRPRPAPRPLAELPDPLRPAEAAEVLRCSLSTLRKLYREDGLRVVRWGSGRGVAVIYKADLAEYIERKRGAAAR